MGEKHVLQIHGFRCDPEAKTLRFDLVTDFTARDPEAVYLSVLEKVKELYPDFAVMIHHDSDYSD